MYINKWITDKEMETVKLIIDRRPVEVPKGTTILDAANGMGIRIPTLCYMKRKT